MDGVDLAAVARALAQMALRNFGVAVKIHEQDVEGVVRSTLEEPRHLLLAIDDGLATREEVTAAVGDRLHAYLVDALGRAWEDSGVSPEDSFLAELQAALFSKV